MPSPRNIRQLADLKDKFSRAKLVVFADHSGLSVAKQQELKSGIRRSGGEMTVAKNTLLKLALRPEAESKEQKAKSDERETFASMVLSGPTSVLFSFQDEVLPIKVLAKFSENHEKPTIKAGLLGDKPLTADQVKELAKLPGLDELIVRLMWQMQGPMSGLVNVMQGNTHQLVLVLRAIENKKQS